MEKTNMSLSIEESIRPDDGYAVIMFNDDVTPFDYVVAILVEIFEYEMGAAVDKMFEIHNGTSAAVGIYSLEEAQKKVNAVDTANEHTGFLLQTNIQKM